MYVYSKVLHMRRMGTPADLSPSGAACPKWREAEAKANDARVDRRRAAEFRAEYERRRQQGELAYA